MLQSLQFYYLFQAYDLLGHRLYGREWTGQEYALPEIVPPGAIEARRAPLVARISEINAEVHSAKQRIGKTTSASKIRSEEIRLRRLDDERGRLHAELWRMPDAGESHRRDFDARQRRENAEARLLEGLRKGELQAHAGVSALIPQSMWLDGIKLFLELSLAKLPRQWSNMRRCSVLIPRDSFDRWRDGVVPLVSDESNPVSPEALARDFARTALAAQERPRRDALIADLQDRFPGLSGRAAKRIWDSEAPAVFKRSGRPERRKESNR